MMLLRAASALMIVIACCGIAAAADLEVLPKGHPKKHSAVPTRPVIPRTPMHPGPVLPAPAPQAPTPQTPAPQTPAVPTPEPEQVPQQPSRLQSPQAPADQGQTAPDGDKRLNDLQPPALPAPSDRESWWQKVVRNAPHCRTFSDGCRTCDATFTCSSMPIACQPKEFVCTDPASPPSK
ncbi:hypothetical protein [Pseudorhodoplanes sinuspersici]|uniref:Uncharacterized protein n=1 Tax=Pseudorhodoplanes sinuspersici TaxID=1235591 RepID=A0A1W6ZNP3_9HYPH|nr:hypothetical protein [Pseudorhodoplanes sinuspersici]ARP98404.1 hypothetical protein CAK95_04340 [Pseudorhodoplanes sinuspersici]